MIRPVRLVRFLAAAAIAAPSLVLAQGAAYDIDPAHTVSGFSVKHLVISTVRGEFGKTTGAVVLDDKDPSKDSVTATIDVTSINTRVEQRDTHLKSPDFFDSAKFPAITFKSSKVEKAGEGKYKVTGDLTIKGTTKPVVLDVTGPTAEIKDPWGNARRGFAATTQINRKDFGLNWSKTIEAGPVVGDDVKIEIDGELVKQAAKAAAK
ncbi:MAG TPA: YceI family protein [Anaeromyxobacteraceae bacterium]|nr:YceI family protein [Anaeromyxobacteraceae bacterium]